MDLNLRGRTVLITGASKGIGLATAEVLAEEGCNVILVSRTQADLDAARTKILSRFNVGVTVHALDLSNSESVDKLAELHGDVDFLINNAGAIPPGKLHEIAEPRWREAWDLKVFGYINMCRAFYAKFAARRRGVILNIIGTGGEKLDSAYIAGAAGNASLMAFTRALGGTASNDNLRVLGINPGPVATDRLVTMMKKIAQDRLGDASRWEELTAPMPFGRAATSEEIAYMAAFLVSDRSSYTSGTIVTIDGGAVNRTNVF